MTGLSKEADYAWRVEALDRARQLEQIIDAQSEKIKVLNAQVLALRTEIAEKPLAEWQRDLAAKMLRRAADLISQSPINNSIHDVASALRIAANGD